MDQTPLAKLRPYLAQARPFLPHAAALFLFALLGWMNGYVQASRTIDNPNLKETWAVPDWAPTHVGPERAVFATLDIWDGKKPLTTAARQEAPAKKAWEFVGTVRTGRSYAAMILVGDSGRVQRALPGDVLPNGEKIIAVGNGSLQIDVSGDHQEIKLFQPEKK